MFTRWSLRVGLACSLACSPLVLAGQEKSLPQQIADQLVLSLHTVNAHVRNIFGKIGVNSRAAAARFVVEHGLV